MPRVDFYYPLADVMAFARKLLQTAYHRQSHIFVLLANASVLQDFSVRLWCLKDDAFIPHCNIQSKEVSETPIILGTTIPEHNEKLPAILLNLTEDANPKNYAMSFERVLEMTQNTKESQAIAHERLIYYQSQAFEIYQHDMSASLVG